MCIFRFDVTCGLYRSMIRLHKLCSLILYLYRPQHSWFSPMSQYVFFGRTVWGAFDDTFSDTLEPNQSAKSQQLIWACSVRLSILLNPFPNTPFWNSPKFKEAADNNWNVAIKGFLDRDSMEKNVEKVEIDHLDNFTLFHNVFLKLVSLIC